MSDKITLRDAFGQPFEVPAEEGPGGTLIPLQKVQLSGSNGNQLAVNADGSINAAVSLETARSGQAVAVTPNDDADLALTPTEYLSVNTSGTVTLTTDNGETIAVYLVRGTLHRIRAKRILATGTEATGIVAWYDPDLAYEAGSEDYPSDGLIAGFDMARPAGTQVWLDEVGDKVITAGNDSSVESTDPVFDGVKATLDGSNDLLNAYSGALKDDFNGAAGTLIVFAQAADAGVWNDAQTRYLANFGADGNNVVRIFKGSSANQVLYRYVAGATTKTVIDTTPIGAAKTMFAVTWDNAADEFKAYLNGEQVGATQTGLGVWAGSLAPTLALLGAASTTGTTPWSGSIYAARVYDQALTAETLAAIYALAIEKGHAE